MLNDSTVNTSTLNRKGRYANDKSKSSSLLFNCGKRSLQRGGKKKNSKYQRKETASLAAATLISMSAPIKLTHALAYTGFVVNPDEILTYEEVYYFHPRPNFKVAH